MRNRSHNSRRRFRVEQQRPHAPARIEARAYHAHGAFVSPLQWEVERAWPAAETQARMRELDQAVNAPRANDGHGIHVQKQHVAEYERMDTAAAIVHAQALLDELLLRFTDKHPDVIAAGACLRN